MKKKWQYYPNKDEKQIEEIQKEYKINKLLATILSNRGIIGENVGTFLNPTRHDFHDPYEMPDMKEAITRIIKAIQNKEKTIIYGDYDVDGITSITILKSFLKDRGLEVDSYIPNRLQEGYGLNEAAIKKIAKENYTLMITVDCGITGIKEIELAKSLGMEVIVTDHHEPTNELPNTIAVIDCKRKDNVYPFRELAGVGVVFKLIQALSIKLELDEKEYLKYLDIVAVGTISDIVPLIDENRVITKLGLKLINCTKNVGLKAILNDSGYSKIDSTTISFGVAPRINACGRMGLANEALDLLLESDSKKAAEIASKIRNYNNLRQQEEKKIFEEADNEIKENHLENSPAIVLCGNNWHSGVIGIVASKITEIYYKPSILVCFDDEGDIGKGSGRSVLGFDLHLALMNCEDTLEGFGGHSMAVGVSVKKDKFERFKNEFIELVKKSDALNLVPILNIDDILNIDEIDQDMVKSLLLLEPYGEANQMPIFAFKNLKISSIRTLSEGKHLKLELKSNNNNFINVIGFNLGNLASEYKIGDRVDVAGNLGINSYNGIESIQINLKDIMKTI